jgi:hypothetical protein
MDVRRAAVVKQLKKQRDGTVRELAGRERTLRAMAARNPDEEKKRGAVAAAEKIHAESERLKAKFDKLIAEKSGAGNEGGA